MADYEKKVRQELSDNGCYYVRHGKGDHDIWFSPITNKHITVDGTIKSRHTANAVMKQAGIKKTILIKGAVCRSFAIRR